MSVSQTAIKKLIVYINSIVLVLIHYNYKIIVNLWLHINNLTIMSVFLSLFQYYILYSEEYISLMIDMINTALNIYLKRVPLCVMVYYLLITAGYSISMVSIKLFITISIMIANIIDIYLLGILVVLVNILIDIEYFGLILIAYLLYLFLTRMEVFLLILFILEGFSIMFQSLTLSNRLSINIMAGSLVISLLSI